MPVHLEREIEKLKKMILALGSLVEQRLMQASNVVARRDIEVALAIEEGDREIDVMEVEVEEECLKALALYQPVAIDLRFIIAVLKINNDLERIGDLAVNIASRGRSLAKLPQVHSPFNFDLMAEKVMKMLRQSLEALVRMDASIARKVMESDDDIDNLHRQMYASLSTRIRENPEEAEAIIHFISVSRNLERVADHTTNIAEDVIYMIDGEIVRHGVRA